MTVEIRRGAAPKIESSRPRLPIPSVRRRPRLTQTPSLPVTRGSGQHDRARARCPRPNHAAPEHGEMPAALDRGWFSDRANARARDNTTQQTPPDTSPPATMRWSCTQLLFLLGIRQRLPALCTQHAPTTGVAGPRSTPARLGMTGRFFAGLPATEREAGWDLRPTRTG